MNMEGYAKALEYAEKNGKRFMCRYCGNVSIAVGQAAVCQNCELPVYTEEAKMKEREPQTFALISDIKEKMDSGNYDAAMAAYDSAYKNGSDAGYLYAEALLCIKQSNAQIDSIKYDRKGFMDENTAMRDNAAKLASKAKALMEAAIKASEPHMMEERPPLPSVYLTFLCNMKLMNLREANDALQKLNKIDSYLGMYGKMMLDLNLGKQEEAIADAESILKPERFSANALFYIALVLFDKRKYKESKEMVELVRKYIQGREIDTLSSEIEYATNV
ncbi:MAG TPA: hypothetical protein VL944_03575 [Candidatus Acidoferrum sp.]|nr:hypothetical protein [Candidatus Acidoferrum sp.]